MLVCDRLTSALDASATVLARPCSDYTRTLLAAVPRIKGQARADLSTVASLLRVSNVNRKAA